MNKFKVLAILGPTSSGKSELAIKLAKKFNGEIISADSRQVYRNMDIGTGKVHGKWSKKHKAFLSKGIPHYLIDIVSPKTEYNIAKFKRDANYIINYLHNKNKLPIICGGTGFWIKSVVDDIDFPEVKPDKILRDQLSNKSPDLLFEILQKLDPDRSKNIDAKNKVRLIRAIEICKAIGKVPKIVKHKKWRSQNSFLQIGIDISREQLHKNIKKRLEKRFRSGMIEEVEKLHKQGLSFKKIQSFGLGYHWIPLYIRRKINKEELFEKIYHAEKEYAKRQMTWFKKDKRIKWLKNYQEIEKEVIRFLK